MKKECFKCKNKFNWNAEGYMFHEIIDGESRVKEPVFVCKDCGDKVLEENTVAPQVKWVNPYEEN